MEETIPRELDNLYHQQIRLVQFSNFAGKYPEVLTQIEKAAEFIPKEKFTLQNILDSEKEIALKQIQLASKIRSLTVTLTNKCNLACLMCKTRDISWEIPQKAIREIIALFPYLERIMWQGGEAFLYGGFKELLKEASKFPMRQLVATNGLLIDREIAEIIVKAKVELTLSIDGVSKEVYEYIRKGSNFERLIENINLINELRERLNPGMQTRLNVVIMQANCHQLEQFLDFAKQYKFNRLFFNIAGADFKNLNENIFYYNRNKEILGNINKIRPKIAKKAQEYGISLENWLPGPDFFSQDRNWPAEKKETYIPRANKLLCHAPWQRLYIDCGGNVRPDCFCPVDNYIGNITESTLAKLWNNEKIKEYRRRIINQDCADFCSADCISGRVPELNLKFV